MEVNTIDTALGELSLPPIRRIAFLGSGPTPFTSLCIQERYGASVAPVNIDRSPEAIQLGSNLVQRCGFSNITFQEAEVASLSDLRSFDLVHFAALLGDDPEQKRDLLIRVAKCMRPGALILLRTTESLRSVLYPPFQPDDREILGIVTPVVATRYFGASTSLTAIVMSVDAPMKPAS
jgi:nicotianamine synthase